MSECLTSLLLADVLWELMIKELDAANPANDDGGVRLPHSANAAAATTNSGCCFWQRRWMQVVHVGVIFTRVQMIQVGCMTMNRTDVA